MEIRDKALKHILVTDIGSTKIKIIFHCTVITSLHGIASLMNTKEKESLRLEVFDLYT